jgi:hypothetical protein
MLSVTRRDCSYHLFPTCLFLWLITGFILSYVSIPVLKLVISCCVSLLKTKNWTDIIIIFITIITQNFEIVYEGIMLQEILTDYTIKTYLLIECLTCFDGPPSFTGVVVVLVCSTVQLWAVLQCAGMFCSTVVSGAVVCCYVLQYSCERCCSVLVCSAVQLWTVL